MPTMNELMGRAPRRRYCALSQALPADRSLGRAVCLHPRSAGVTGTVTDSNESGQGTTGVLVREARSSGLDSARDNPKPRVGGCDRQHYDTRQ